MSHLYPYIILFYTLFIVVLMLLICVKDYEIERLEKKNKKLKRRKKL